MITNSGTRWLQDNTVVLPNGRNVVLASKEGANNASISNKKTCHDHGSGDDRPSGFKTPCATMLVFVESNSFDIVKQIYKKAQEQNVSKTELFIERET
jgi:hypothetical protein